MSKVLDVQIAESSPAASVETPAVPYMDRVRSLKGEERAHYDLTGELPKDTPPAKPADPPPADAVSAESSTEAIKGPELATGDDDPEQLTPAQRRANNRNLRNELIKANAEKELLKSQLAESRKSAPAAPQPTSDQKALDKALPAGYPRLKDFPDDPGGEKWEAAVNTYHEARHETSVKSAVSQALEMFKAEQREANWGTKLKAAKLEFKDFEKIALNPKTPVSYTGIRVMQAREDFGKIAYYLGQHPEEAERIANATSFANDDKLNADPIQRAKAEARLEAEFDSIARQLATAPPKKTADEQISDLPRPSSQVDVSGKNSQVGDPIAQALKNKDFKTYARLKNEEEAAAYKTRR